jgi:hypothetical protein
MLCWRPNLRDSLLQVQSVRNEMLANNWRDTQYRLDVCCAINGTHFEIHWSLWDAVFENVSLFSVNILTKYYILLYWHLGRTSVLYKKFRYSLIISQTFDGTNVSEWM